MDRSTILAIVIAVIIILLVVMQWMWSRRYGGVCFGYFTNLQNLGAIFPQTGDNLMLTKIAGRYVVATFDEKTHTILPRYFPEFGGGVIVIRPEDLKQGSNVSRAAAVADITLFVCANPSDAIDQKVSPRLIAMIDGDTKMPTVKLGDAASPTALWRFHPVLPSYHERMHQLMGLAPPGRRDLFAEMPQKFPSWVAKNSAFTTAIKTGAFRGYLKNLKYDGFQYPSEVVEMKRWGNVGIVLSKPGSMSPALEDPQILLVPTDADMVFRAFSMRSAMPNKTSGRLENYLQLVATSGAKYELSKHIIDTDAARWILVIVP